jgi:hypothetical protein
MAMEINDVGAKGESMIEDSTEWWDLLAFYGRVPSARLAATMHEDSREWRTLSRLSGAVPFARPEGTVDGPAPDRAEIEAPRASRARHARARAAPRRRRLEIAVVLSTILLVVGLWVLLPKH